MSYKDSNYTRDLIKKLTNEIIQRYCKSSHIENQYWVDCHIKVNKNSEVDLNEKYLCLVDFNPSENSIIYYDYYKCKTLISYDELEKVARSKANKMWSYKEYEIWFKDKEIRLLNKVNEEELYKGIKEHTKKHISFNIFKECRENGTLLDSKAKEIIIKEIESYEFNPLFVIVLVKDFYNIKMYDLLLNFIRGIVSTDISKDMLIYLILEERNRILERKH